MNDTTVTDAYISTREAAFMLDVSRSTLKNWRTRELFGCKFFTADKKIGNTWYYLRERVEQLKSVYQPGILQSMYKLARNFSYNFQKSVSSSDYFHKLVSSSGNADSLLLPEDEVAEILEIDKSTLFKLSKQKIFVEDSIDHLDVFWYSAKRVKEFKDARENKSSNLTELRDQLKQIPYSVLANHGFLQTVSGKDNEFICPECGNGSGDNHTGIKEHIENNGVRTSTCFKCDQSFDNIRILALHYGLDEKSDFTEIIKRGASDLLNESINENSSAYNIHNNTKKRVETYSRLQESLINLPNFFANLDTWRGLPEDTLQKIGWGFLPDFSHPKKTWEVFSAVIIPNIKNGILAREVDGDRKSNIAPAAPTIIYLPDGSDFILTITEGAINAASLAYATDFKYPFIAAGGTSGVNEIVTFLKEKFPDDKPKINIQFDNDSSGAGQKAAEKLLNALTDAEFLAVTSYLDEKDFDENSILQRDGKDYLSLTFERILTNASSRLDKLADFQKKLLDWQEINGFVSAQKLAELKSFADELNSFTTENLTEDVATDLVILNKVAHCKFYSFYSQAADHFIATLNSVAKNFANFAIKDSMDKLAALVKKVRQAHKDFLKNQDAENEKKESEEKKEQAKQRRNQLFQRLQDLKNAPLSEQVIAEIRSILRELCEWKYSKIFNTYHRECIKPTAKNLTLIFENDPCLDGLVGYDEFLQCEVFLKQPVWKKNNCIKEEWQDSDDNELRFFLRDNYAELSNKDLVQDTFIHFSRQYQFNVMKDFFNNLPTWDKKTRVEKLFVNWLRADDSPYTREVTKIWLVAAMARVFHPGCTFQAAIVLQGQQLIGKSHILEKLGGNFYTVLSDNVDDSHALDALLNSWIVEIKEFSAARKVDINSLKSFLERSTDNRRLAYAKRAKLFKRHIVFAITLNDLQFLRDLTGNRRYWIIPCHGTKLQPIIEVDGEKMNTDYIQQVWAEVKVIYSEMFDNDSNFDDKKLQLSLENKITAENIAYNFIQDDGLRGQIEAGLEILIPPEYLWNVLTLEERREFFKHNFISIEASRLNERLITVKNDADRENLEIFLSSAQGTCTISGTVKRQHISAAEIKNEFFDKIDRRPSAQKINEILQLLDNWQLGNRIPHSAYGDLRKVYYRVNDEDTTDPITEEPFAVDEETDDLPF